MGRLGRALGILLLIAILAGIIAAVVLLTTNAGQNAIDDLTRGNLPDQIQAIEDFINGHTG
jgi:hypothetical protein